VKDVAASANQVGLASLVMSHCALEAQSHALAEANRYLVVRCHASANVMMGGKERIVTSLYVQWWMANFVLGEESVSMEDASAKWCAYQMVTTGHFGLGQAVTPLSAQKLEWIQSGLCVEV
jgi:hypothetical protein